MANADLAFVSGIVTFVGRNHRSRVDEMIDSRVLMVMPSLVNIHRHAASEVAIARCERSWRTAKGMWRTVSCSRQTMLLRPPRCTKHQSLHEASVRVKANVSELDWSQRTAEQISPLIFRKGVIAWSLILARSSDTAAVSPYRASARGRSTSIDCAERHTLCGSNCEMLRPVSRDPGVEPTG